jgi:hypothetical protein
MIDPDEAQELRQQDRRERRQDRAFFAHPDPRDPEHQAPPAQRVVFGGRQHGKTHAAALAIAAANRAIARTLDVLKKN